MPNLNAVLVDIVRDFFSAHRIMGRISERYRTGELRFEELAALVGDDEDSVLYRLKERCHALFRPGPRGEHVPNPREVLFDLAVGALFHEAMKLRENFYQREVYGPRVRAVRSEAAEESEPFFAEFEKIMADVSERLDEGLQETETLVEHTAAQLRRLLAEQRDNGFIVRHLIENADSSESIFGSDLDTLLAEIYGSAADGYARAGEAYLMSGYYEAADAALASAIERDGDHTAVEPLRAYALGMSAYLASDYAECLRRLTQWADAGQPGQAALSDLARGAISRISQLVDDDDRGRLLEATSALLDTMGRSPQPDPAAEI